MDGKEQQKRVPALRSKPQDAEAETPPPPRHEDYLRQPTCCCVWALQGPEEAYPHCPTQKDYPESSRTTRLTAPSTVHCVSTYWVACLTASPLRGSLGHRHTGQDLFHSPPHLVPGKGHLAQSSGRCGQTSVWWSSVKRSGRTEMVVRVSRLKW